MSDYEIDPGIGSSDWSKDEGFRYVDSDPAQFVVTSTDYDMYVNYLAPDDVVKVVKLMKDWLYRHHKELAENEGI
jgi:hypothetical protein